MDVFDQVVADAAAEAQPIADANEPNATDEVVQSEKVEQPNEVEDQKPVDDDAFPKKAVNALARRDRKIGKLTAQRDALQSRISELEQLMQQKAPREEDFQDRTYDELLAAKAEHAADKRYAERELNTVKQQQASMDAELSASQRDLVDESAAKAVEMFSDFQEVIEKSSVLQNGQKLIPLSDEARNAFFRTENAAAALYAICKDGALDVLNSLPALEAAMMVKEYEIKAERLPQIKRKSTAPEPIPAARGRASGSKSIEDMNPEEAHKFLTSR